MAAGLKNPNEFPIWRKRNLVYDDIISCGLCIGPLFFKG